MFNLKHVDINITQALNALISASVAFVVVWGLRGQFCRSQGIQKILGDSKQVVAECEQLKSDRPAKNRRARKQEASPNFCGATKKTGTSSSAMKLDYLDRFLRWDCGLTLQQMGLFPNAKEITESMACLNAIEKHLAIRLADASTTCVVVGDGSTPRTAALLAMRSKWRRIVSVDPALKGLPLADCQEVDEPKVPIDIDAAQSSKRRLNKVEQQAHQATQEAPRRERLKEKHMRIAELDRLELVPSVIESFSINIEHNLDEHVVVLLPHAHVVPEIALQALALDEVLLPNPPVISVVQLPCCQFKKHNSIFGQSPDVEYDDACICGPAQQVRIWKNACAFTQQLGKNQRDAEGVLTEKRGRKRSQRNKLLPGSSLSLVNFKAHLQPQYHVSPCIGSFE